MQLIMTHAHTFQNDIKKLDEKEASSEIIRIAKNNFNKHPYSEEMDAAIRNNDSAYIVRNWFSFTNGSEWMALEELNMYSADYGKAG